MTPEPSFTQALREEGFIQGSDVESKANEVKEEVIDKVPEKVENDNVDSVKEDVQTTVEDAKASVDEAKEKGQQTTESIKKDEIVQTTPSSSGSENISLIIIGIIIIILIIIILHFVGLF